MQRGMRQYVTLFWLRFAFTLSYLALTHIALPELSSSFPPNFMCVTELTSVPSKLQINFSYLE